MAEKFSHFVLNNRKLFIFLILIYTAFMGYKGLDVEYNYDFSQTVPDTDEEMMYYNSFKNTFGELPTRTRSPFVVANSAQDSRGSMFEAFRDEIPTFFWIALALIFDRFCDNFSTAFRSLFRSMSLPRVKSPISAES